jgi:hypothetical protein
MKRQQTPYLNAYNPDHFWTQRRAMPPWHPPRPALDVDAVVFIIVTIIAAIVAFGVAWTEGGL